MTQPCPTPTYLLLFLLLLYLLFLVFLLLSHPLEHKQDLITLRATLSSILLTVRQILTGQEPGG
jgi:hypothetical protein